MRIWIITTTLLLIRDFWHFACSSHPVRLLRESRLHFVWPRFCFLPHLEGAIDKFLMSVVAISLVST
ncbi:hypothetical protein SEVIR_7G046732v4 [Setaria viridis]